MVSCSFSPSSWRSALRWSILFLSMSRSAKLSKNGDTLQSKARTASTSLVAVGGPGDPPTPYPLTSWSPLPLPRPCPIPTPTPTLPSPHPLPRPYPISIPYPYPIPIAYPPPPPPARTNELAPVDRVEVSGHTQTDPLFPYATLPSFPYATPHYSHMPHSHFPLYHLYIFFVSR